MIRLVKLAIISFVVLFLVATGISLLIPSQIRISKAINFHNSQRNDVFSLVKNQNRWKEWHPVFLNDSLSRQMAIDIKQKHSSDSDFVVIMQQPGKQAVASGWQLYHYAHTDSITLQWYLDFKLKWYPWQKFGSLFYENTYGRMMEQGLTNLKQAVENLPK
jgi:hypothetical protein